MRDSAKYALLCVWIAAGAWTLFIDDPRLRFMSYLVAQLAMGVSWVVLCRAPVKGRFVVAALTAAIAFRLAALSCAPAFSEDVFRYVFEGRVVWDHGLGFPFRHPPADAPGLGVNPAMLDAAWLRINHPHLSTIYPPASQLVFVIAAKLGEVLFDVLTSLKLLLILAEVGAGAVVVWAARAEHRGRVLLTWGLCPLLVWEIAREGHADSISALGLAIGVVAFTAGQARRGYGGWALAALAKLNGLLILPFALRVSRRGAWVLILLLPWLLLPYVLVGPEGLAGLSAYAQKWRSGDGLFTLTLGAARTVLGGDWHRVSANFTITAHQLARAFTGAGLAVVMAGLLRDLDSLQDVPRRAATFLLVVLLAAPTLHPWYVIWLLPFVASTDFIGRRAALLLAVMAPVLHHPGWMALETGEWRDLGWVRALVHVPVWLLLVVDLVQKRSLGYPSPQQGE